MVKIFIDPGHGGVDPGARGYQLKEKDLTLSIALKLRDYLNKQYTGHSIKMSRTTDKTVSLKARTNAANSWNADYLISIHINSGGGTGFESYIYNRTNNKGTINKQTIIHNEVMKYTAFGDRGKKRANLHMLRESRMNAILTENGFIDNKNDAAKLKSNAFLNQIAKGHALGLARALGLKRKTVTSVDNPNSYTIKRGDTLWSLAKKYNTTVSKIMELNPNIVPKSLPVGKKIALPRKT